MRILSSIIRILGQGWEPPPETTDLRRSSQHDHHCEGAYEVPSSETILTDEALAFVEELHTRFTGTRDELLENRKTLQSEAAKTGKLDFPAETQGIRDGDWTVAEHPASLQDRRVEITGPPAPAKMAINALNSGAKVWLACLEDALSPSWSNLIDAQKNLHEAARRTLKFTSPEGKEYTLREDITLPTVVVRPRGWHLPEKHVEIDGRPAVGALVDFGLHFFHNAKLLHEQGEGPFYYLPKIEHYREARLWNDVFSFAEQRLGLPHGAVRATVLIETIRRPSRWMRSSTSSVTMPPAERRPLGLSVLHHQVLPRLRGPVRPP